jgi:omega-amidase
MDSNNRSFQTTAATQAAANTQTNAANTAAASASHTNQFATAPNNSSTLRVSLVQLNVTADKVANLKHARDLVLSAVSSSHADVVVLPEMFNCPYSNDSFGPYSEELPSGNSCAVANISKETSPSAYALSQLAREAGVYLVGGSMPEREANGTNKPFLYNTCLVFDPQGNIIAKHRKVHLFDIDVPGKMTFKESDTLTAGSQFTSFTIQTNQIKSRQQQTSHATYTSGLGICYDIRFPLYAQTLRAQGVDMFIYPGAFNTTTGPLHWELLARARAVDNQSAVIVCSPARSPTATYQAWGHSSIVSPWGKVLATTEHEESIVTADINMNEVYEMRRNIPVSKQQRTDMYQLSNVQKK